MRRVQIAACAARSLSVLALVALGACGANATSATEREPLDLERMRRQQRLTAYGEGPRDADGMAMRVPPAGTISREELALGTVAATGRQRGDYATAVPVRVTPALLAQGEHDFGIYCAPCHGDDATGGARTVVGANLRPPPPSLVTGPMRALPAGRVFEIVTRRVGRMPSYAWALPVAGRWAVVAYLGTLQGVAARGGR